MLTTSIHKLRYVLLLVCWGCSLLAQSQSLLQADYAQFENQIRDFLNREYFSTLDAYVKAQREEDAVTLRYKLLSKAWSANTQVFSDVSPAPAVTWAQFLTDVRLKNTVSKSNFSIGSAQDAPFQRPATIQFVGTDSLVTSIYVKQRMSGGRAGGSFAIRTVPLTFTISARFKRDASSQLGYFYNIQIGNIRSGVPPAGAIAFSSDQTVKTNPYPIYLAEQSLGRVLAKAGNSLAEKLPATATRLFIKNLSYRNCGIGDAFALEVGATLQTYFSTLLNRPKLTISTTEATPQSYTLTGQYEDNGSLFQLTMLLLGPNGQQLGRVVNSDLPLNWFEANNRRFIPADYAKINKETNTLNNYLVSDDRNLSLRLNTNKGRESARFFKGDTMHLFVEVNKPSHVRVLYRQAPDPQGVERIVLLCDRVIKPSETSVNVLLGDFVCSEPYGSERLVAVAATDPMCPLTIDRQTIGGLTFEFVNESLEEALKSSREKSCMRGLGQSGSPFKAFDQLLITTLPVQ
ncbi:hypothetical protein GCM10027592_60220 [Spirosoma flavus]